MVSSVGFLEYAFSVFLEKDLMKTKLLLSPKAKFSKFFQDNEGFVCIFPEPTVREENERETISLMGYNFPANTDGQRQLVRLFGASVLHLRCHVLVSESQDYEEWAKGKKPQLAKFVATLIEDLRADAYCAVQYPDKLGDLAFANTLALKRLRRLDRLLNSATKMMGGLLIRSSTGQISVTQKSEHDTINHLAKLLDNFKKKATHSLQNGNITLKDEKLEIADEIYYAIEDAGPITETPFLPHTEELGACSIFLPSYLVDSDVTNDSYFRKCLEYLGGVYAAPEGSLETKGKIADVEAVQVFDSWKHQKEKDQKLVERYQTLVSSTGFKSVEIPEQDYTEFLRIKARCKSEAHRLIESLLVARDALDEDPRKNYGVLDLQEVIQVIASKSPRLDVFMLDENLSKSYSWAILLDASKSMKYLRDFALEILTILGDSANELLLDPTSWGMYAFSDRFFIIKDPKERYNIRVKSRIGGIKFEGSTLLSDALTVAGQIVKSRAENLRLITVVSDGYQYTSAGMPDTLLPTIDELEARSISLIGIGTKSKRMESLFKTNCSVYNLRELSRKFSHLYMSASIVAAEA
jgi:Txe/YoeB family toxin of Txe-Axe toxin-antitoxin module